MKTKETNIVRLQYKICLVTVSLLLLGFVFGIGITLLVHNLPLNHDSSVKKAILLGITSRTIVDGYSKNRDVIEVYTLIISSLICGIALWWAWAHTRKNELNFLFNFNHEVKFSNKRMAVLAFIALVLPFCILLKRSDFIGPVPTWAFFREEGMILAAANEILSGRVQGLDFYSPFGPIMTTSLALIIKIFGRYVSVARYYSLGLHLLSYVAAAYILNHLIRQRAVAIGFMVLFVVVYPFDILPHSSYLRFTLGLIPIVLFCRNQTKWSSSLAGFFVGYAFLFSQEAGICSAVTLIGFITFLDNRRLLDKVQHIVILILSTIIAVTPYLWYLTFKGGLYPFVHDLIEYPRLVALGYCGLPSPSLAQWLRNPTGQALIFYWPVVIYIAALLYAFPAMIISGYTQRIALLISVAVYGIMLFRIALGRSDIPHVINASPPAFFALSVLIDIFWEKVSCWFISMTRAIWTVWGILLSLMVIVIVYPIAYYGMQRISAPTAGTSKDGKTYRPLSTLDGILVAESDLRQIQATHEFLNENLKQNETVYFFPNAPIYYFIFGLPSPTRFHQAYLAVTTTHRQEVVRDLERTKPAYLVYDLNRENLIDEIPEEIQVPEILDYLKQNYSLASQPTDTLAIFCRNANVR